MQWRQAIVEPCGPAENVLAWKCTFRNCGNHSLRKKQEHALIAAYNIQGGSPERQMGNSSRDAGDVCKIRLTASVIAEGSR